MEDKFVERTYRDRFKNDRLVYFNVVVKQTDLRIAACRNLYCEALSAIIEQRNIVESYIMMHPEFQTSFVPVKPAVDASFIIKKMCTAAYKANVGPMAAIAGAISETVGSKLTVYSDEIIVENGGDLYVKCKSDIKVGIYAGDSPFKDKLALNIKASQMPLGICTSSGKIGPSVSLGKSDAVTVLSKDTCVSDAAATAIANRIKCARDIDMAIEYAKTIQGVLGVIAIYEDKIGVWGNMELVPWS